MLRVKKQTLLLVAGIVWLIAGANILNIGLRAFFALLGQSIYYFLLLLPALLIFVGFFMMFQKIVKKHTNRILGYAEEKKSVFYFFDGKGYLLMIFMIGLGVGLRVGLKLPDVFFAFFYTGLASGLISAGVLFYRNWMRTRKQIKQDGTLN